MPIIAHIPGSRSLVNDHTPIERGCKCGYFKDKETKALLSLNKGDFLRADGTYGDKEITHWPVDFTLLHKGSYDHRFLPFVPKRQGSLQSMYVELREKKRQWMPVAHSLKELWDELVWIGLKSEKIAALMKLPLPEYAYRLLPLVRVQLMRSPPFKFQFQPWFDLEAHQARWHHIEWIIGLLEGYINMGHLLLNPEQWTWHLGDPVGIQAELAGADAEDQALALAYSYLSTPISLPADWKLPRDYTLLDVRRALLDKVQDLTDARAVYPLISELPEDHYDGLAFIAVQPNYSELCYNADGTRTTKLQCKQLEQEESTDMAEASDSEDSDADAPRPTARIIEVMEDVQPSKATTPAPSHREEDKVMAATSSSSALDPFHLNLPETSLMSQWAALRLDTSG